MSYNERINNLLIELTELMNKQQRLIDNNPFIADYDLGLAGYSRWNILYQSVSYAVLTGTHISDSPFERYCLVKYYFKDNRVYIDHISDWGMEHEAFDAFRRKIFC